jgi:hypothetical protein
MEVLKNLTILKNNFTMLIPAYLQNLTIDVELLVSNLQNIITSSFEMILPEFLNQPKILKNISKLSKQLDFELSRITNYRFDSNKNDLSMNNNLLKQTIDKLKNIKMIVNKLKTAYREYKKKSISSRNTRLFKENTFLNENEKFNQIQRGIELMKCASKNFNTFSENEYGAKNNPQDIKKGNSNYNMNILANIAESKKNSETNMNFIERIDSEKINSNS